MGHWRASTRSIRIDQSGEEVSQRHRRRRTDETPAPDRNAALSMLGTFDLDDVDFRSPDEILATLAPEPTVSGPDDPPQASPADERAVTRDVPAVDDVQSDEILRELEEHHQRGQTTARPSAPRGSAELQPTLAAQAQPTRKRSSKPSPRRIEAARAGANGSCFRWPQPRCSRLPQGCDAVSAGRHGRPRRRPPFGQAGSPRPPRSRWRRPSSLTRQPTRSPMRIGSSPGASSRRSGTTVASRASGSAQHGTTWSPTRPWRPPPRRRRRVPPLRTAARARRPRQALSPRPARPLRSSNTSHQSQPAFGQNGSLGPGRGAPGTQ